MIQDKFIIVTGGAGFFGSRIVDKFREFGCRHILVPRSAELDLRSADDIDYLYDKYRPDIVIHAAAHVGGIGLNQKQPADLFYDNAIMGIQMIHAAARYGIEKFVQIGTVCAYPKFTPVPFKESDLWVGYPEETNAPYGIAKKALLVQGQAYRQQYGLNFIYLLPVNMYGPGDNCDSENSHVVPGLIRKFVEARRHFLPEVTLWGTGEASREFLYVDDGAEAVVLATEKYNKPEPVNLATGKEIKIKDLAAIIATLVGYEGRIVYDSSRPDGQPRRSLDVSRAKEEFGFEAKTNFYSGLRETIKWYHQKSQN